jgi:polyisoprenoid-binding protein YceI
MDVAVREYIVSTSSRVVVRATSSIHDTVTEWKRVSGRVWADPQDLTQARAEVQVDMRELDAGDWLRNRKLRGDLDVDRYPEARFTLTAVTLTGDAGQPFHAAVTGDLAWRGRSVRVSADGTGTLDERELRAQGSFRLDVRTLGVTPPRILMLKVDDVVAVEVSLHAVVAAG